MFDRNKINKKVIHYYYWWRYEVQLVETNKSIDELVARAIQEKLNKRYKNRPINPNEGIAIDINYQGNELYFTAKAEQTSETYNLTLSTIEIITNFKYQSSTVQSNMQTTNSENKKFEFISEEIEFYPTVGSCNLAFSQTSEKVEEFKNLILPQKEDIKDELIRFLCPEDKAEYWSKEHYNKVIPLVNYLNKSQSPVFIFAGDPGTGKTVLAKSLGAVVSNSLNVTVKLWSIGINVRGIGLQGLASTKVVQLFDYAKSIVQINNSQPLLILFDESEAIIGSRNNAGNGDGSQENIAIVNAIIRGIDQLKEARCKVAVIFISNIPMRVDEALRRRCNYYWFPRPNQDIRKQIFAKLLNQAGFSEADIQEFTDITNSKVKDKRIFEYTGSDIERILYKAATTCINKKKSLDRQTILEACKDTDPTGYFE